MSTLLIILSVSLSVGQTKKVCKFTFIVSDRIQDIGHRKLLVLLNSSSKLKPLKKLLMY